MSKENIESAQKNQKKIEQTEENPETSGPAENLREEAAEMTDKDSGFRRASIGKKYTLHYFSIDLLWSITNSE